MSWCRPSITSHTAWLTRWQLTTGAASSRRLSRASLFGAVIVVAEGALDLEVIAPAAEIDALVAPLGDLRRQLFQRQVGPLAAEQQDRSRHRRLSQTSGERRQRQPRRAQTNSSRATLAARSRFAARQSVRYGRGSVGAVPTLGDGSPSAPGVGVGAGGRRRGGRLRRQRRRRAAATAGGGDRARRPQRRGVHHRQALRPRLDRRRRRGGGRGQRPAEGRLRRPPPPDTPRPFPPRPRCAAAACRRWCWRSRNSCSRSRGSAGTGSPARSPPGRRRSCSTTASRSGPL